MVLKIKSVLKRALGNVVNSSVNGVKSKLATTKRVTNAIIYGRDNFSPSVQMFLKNHGNKQISRIEISRKPLNNVLQGLVGTYKSVEYYRVYHLKMNIYCSDGFECAIDKEHVILAHVGITKSNEEDIMAVNDVIDFTINDLLEGGLSVLGENMFYKYDAFTNNCQDFIIALLKGNNIGNEKVYVFVKQDVEFIFKSRPYLKKLVRGLTDFSGLVIDPIREGGKLNVTMNKNTTNLKYFT